MNILAIETSCDEAAAAVIKDGRQVLSNIIASQVELFSQYGGVVPELAARAHISTIIPTIESALLESERTWTEIDAIAVTTGPGLVGSLLIGTETARTLAVLKKKPILSVNHLAGHIYANWLSQSEPCFPILALIVSGGHSQLISMEKHYRFKVVGETRDDSAGEAFDKVAQLLELPYPGGPNIEKAASLGNENKYPLPIINLTPAPKRNTEGYLEYPKPSLDFSFSGLKTAVLNTAKKEKKLTESQKNDIAASFQKALIQTVSQNVTSAIKAYKPRSFILAGGVAANNSLRSSLMKITGQEKIGFFAPDLVYCTDNAAMIGSAAFYKYQAIGKFEEIKNILPDPNFKLV